MSKQATPRAVKDNEAMAKVNHLRTSPQKLNLVARMIMGMKASTAIAQLEFTPKKVAKDVRKVLQSAVANAENNHGLDVDSLIVAEATVGKDMVLKRFHPRGRGRAGKILKPFSSLRIIVREQKDEA
jgi:large subunit ribosomal protein L22